VQVGIVISKGQYEVILSHGGELNDFADAAFASPAFKGAEKAVTTLEKGIGFDVHYLQKNLKLSEIEENLWGLKKIFAFTKHCSLLLRSSKNDMGSAERKEREKLELKNKILEAANVLFVEKGFEKTSIRKIAEVVEYSPATIYLYFKDKDEIFFQLHIRAFTRFWQEFSKAHLVSNPWERLVFIGKVYLNFALENPGYYDLMFIMKAPMNSLDSDESWDAGKRSHGILEQTVAACVEQGFLQGDPKTLALGFWATVHGYATFVIRDRLRMYEVPDLQDFVFASYEVMMSNLGPR